MDSRLCSWPWTLGFLELWTSAFPMINATISSTAGEEVMEGAPVRVPHSFKTGFLYVISFSTQPLIQHHFWRHQNYKVRNFENRRRNSLSFHRQVFHKNSKWTRHVTTTIPPGSWFFSSSISAAVQADCEYHARKPTPILSDPN